MSDTSKLKATASFLTMAVAMFQCAAAQGTTSDSTSLETVVVTGQRENMTLLRAATAVSAIDTAQIEQFAPLATTDLLAFVPGVHIESSGGESNANVSIRGLPISAGGGKYVHFDEDGLPVLEFGDIAFGNADSYVKADYMTDRIEVVRGGAAATFESNAPGGVINFIDKTGEVAGGAIGVTRGLDFDTTRFDFNYGGHLTDSIRFEIGGFYHVGEGPLYSGFTAQNGGQIKANITKEFQNGFLRIDVKILDDRTPSYAPTPFAVSGSPSDLSYKAVPGFNPLHDSFLSRYAATNSGLGADGNNFTHNVSDGWHVVVHQIGGEFSYNVTKNLHLDDKFKFAQIGGDMLTPYTTNVIGSAASIAPTISVNGLTGDHFLYANGPNAGLPYTGLVAGIVMFDSQNKSFDNFSNKLELTGTYNLDNGGALVATAGYYKSRQVINMEWDWDSYFMEVKGHNAALLDLVSSTGPMITAHGLYAYGSEFWGQCCQRLYDVSYDTDAPYASLSWEQGGLDITGAIRYDMGKATGTYAGGVAAPYDVNHDGVLSRPELRVPAVDTSNPSVVGYNTHYVSWSVDANYAFTDRLAVFAGVSRGGRTNADRLLFGTIDAAGQVIGGQRVAVNMVTQVEGGVKWAGDNFRVLVTPFYASTQETNYDITVVSGSPWKDQVYHAYGVELEAGYNIGNLALSGGATYTHSRIEKDLINVPSHKGNIPQRLADWMYELSAVYTWNPLSVGVSLNGVTDSYTNDDNMYVMPAYVLVNGFVQYAFDDSLSLQLNAHNLFDSVAITEVDNPPTGLPGYVDARTMPGRTVSMSLKYKF